MKDLSKPSLKQHLDAIRRSQDFFKEIAHTKDKYIFDIDKHIFTRFEYDSTIKDILIKL